LNKLLDATDEIANEISKRGDGSRHALRVEVAKIWRLAKKFDGDGEFDKVLKRLYRLAGLSGGRFLRYRAIRDILAEPSLADRVCDYIRCTGTVAEYLAFADAVLAHQEQVYADVNLVVFESFLRLEATGSEAAKIRRIATTVVKRERILPGREDCAAIAPLLMLRFGDRRSLQFLKRTLEDPERAQPAAVIRAAAITYAGLGIKEFVVVRKSAARLLRNHLSETIRFIEEVRRYSEVPDRFKARLRLGWDAVAGKRFLDMRTVLTVRLIMLNDRRAIQDWVRDWKTSLLKDSISEFDRKIIARWIQ